LVQLLRAERTFKSALLEVNDHRRRHRLEGVLGDAWQAYCRFSREVCINSAIGCTTASGIATVPSIVPATWERASYVAIRAVAPAVVLPNLTNTILRKEPTWGDSGKVALVLNALNPSNLPALQAHFVGGLLGPKHCQVVRNAAAHKNSQTFAEVRGLAVHYSAVPIAAPTDALLWKDATTGVHAFESWLDDMRTIASGAIA
jgi:hypothetical protein